MHERGDPHGVSVVPIPGTRRPERPLENPAATELVLTSTELALLEPLAGNVAGDRYPDMTETSSARETR